MRAPQVDPRRRLTLAFTLLVVFAASPALAQQHKKVEDVPLIQAREEVPEHQLLDVGVQVLEHGLPADDDALFELEEKGVYEDVRKSEACYLPVRLMDTLQNTGFWGAVRVVPRGVESVDVVVSGTIVESNGKRIILEMSAHDATGKTWFSKRYKQLADYRAYREKRDEVLRLPFQNLYNRIANDLLAARRKLKDEDVEEIRRVAELEFAADVVPAAFGDYLGTDRKGHTVVLRLPSEDDPMMERVYEVRERDYMLIDALTEHYTNFYAQMDESYANWRKFSYDEILARQKAMRQARMRQVLGAAAILGGILAATDGDPNTSGLSDAGIIGGSMVIQSGMAKAKEAKMHTEALRELASSFDAELEPLLIEVEGQTLRLTGSAEAQYKEWRQLLKQIFAAEMGLPIDPDTGEQIAVDVPVVDAPAAESDTSGESREN